MSIVLVDGLNVRAGPSAGSEKVAQYNSGQIIKSGNLLTLKKIEFGLDIQQVREIKDLFVHSIMMEQHLLLFH